MSYNFKRFTNTRGKFDDRITITGSYSFGLPSQFYKTERIKNYKYAVLFYDKDQGAIAIHFTNNENEKGKFSISHHKKYGGSINAKSFFKSNNLKPEDYKNKYEWTKENVESIGEVYVINLLINDND